MGFLSDFKKARKITQKATTAVNAQIESHSAAKTRSRNRKQQKSATSNFAQPSGKGRSDIFANTDEFDPMPILTLRDWNYGQGLNPDSEGFGFTAPDGRIWPAKNCQISLWTKLGVLSQPVVGVDNYPAAAGPDFAPGKPLKLVAEPDNPHSQGAAIAVTNWAGDKVAGYIPEQRCPGLRKKLKGREFHVMCLNRQHEGGVVVSMKAVIWRPGTLRGAESIPVAPQIADAQPPVS